MVRFAWSNYKRAKRRLYLFELRLCSMALEYLQTEIEALPVQERPIMLWFRRVELFGDDIEQSLHQFFMKRPELQTVTLIGWTRYLGEGASVIDDYIPILNCLNLTEPHQTDPTQFPHHITTVEVEQMRLTRQDLGSLLGGASILKTVKLSRSTLDLEFLCGFCATRTSPRTLKMVQCFANSNTTLEAMAQNSWQDRNQMHELDLQNNRLTAVALASIAELLLQQKHSLRSLKLGSNFELFQIQMAAVSSNAVASSPQQPPTPQLEWWQAFVAALSQMQKLHTVQLEACKMTVQMATELVHAVRKSCRTLNLQGTNLFDDGEEVNHRRDGSSSAAASSSSSSATRRGESHWFFKTPSPPPSAAFFRCLATNGACSLVDLLLGGCNIGNPCARLLFLSLETNRTLRSLDLRDNPMTVQEGTWELSLPRLSPQLVKLWLPLTNFLAIHATTGEEVWGIFETALVQNLNLTNVVEATTARALPSKQRVALSHLALRNKGIARARMALQKNSCGCILWPRIMARLWNGWEDDQNASAVYTFFRRSAEGEEWQSIADVTAGASISAAVTAGASLWNGSSGNDNDTNNRKRPLSVVVNGETDQKDSKKKDNEVE
ncbi:hypothetical protein ACA910_017891 [Epithemia clementina (nom. ined.)]